MSDNPTRPATSYSHTQVALPTVAALVAGLVTQLGWLAASARRGHRQLWAAMPAVAGGAFAAYLLSSLTVVVRSDAVELWFTGGLFRRRVRLADIAQVRVVRVPWWSGWGLRVRRTGLLYIVWGRDAVELELADGSTVAVGSDEPHLLAGALEVALAARPSRAPAD